MLVKRGMCRFAAEILGSKALFSAFYEHVKKSTFSHFSVTLRFQTKFFVCFFRTADKTCVSGGCPLFSEILIQSTRKFQKSRRAENRQNRVISARKSHLDA